MPLSPELQEAVDTAKAGQLAEARSMLKQILRKDPTNEMAWFLYAQIADSPEHAIVCLKKVLEYNPYNERARRELAKLQPDNLLEKTASDKEWNYNSYVEKQEKTQTSAGKGSGVNWKIVIGIGGLIVVGLMLAGGFYLAPSLFPAKPTIAPLKSSLVQTATTGTCNCNEVNAYSDRTVQRFNTLVTDMDAIGGALNDNSITLEAVTQAMGNAQARYEAQRRDTPPPCLDPFDKKMVIIFWNWQQALTSLQQGDNNAVIAFINDIVKQAGEIDAMIDELDLQLSGCPIQRPTPPGRIG
jgi:tetratricopeptide (TPR) repeat protein